MALSPKGRQVGEVVTPAQPVFRIAQNKKRDAVFEMPEAYHPERLAWASKSSRAWIGTKT